MIRIGVHLQKEELPSIAANTHFAGEEREFVTVDVNSAGNLITVFVYTATQAEVLRDAFAEVAKSLLKKETAELIAELDGELDAAAEELKELKTLENRGGSRADGPILGYFGAVTAASSPAVPVKGSTEWPYRS